MTVCIFFGFGLRTISLEVYTVQNKFSFEIVEGFDKTLRALN